jgi:hypothetical protein
MADAKRLGNIRMRIINADNTLLAFLGTSISVFFLVD